MQFREQPIEALSRIDREKNLKELGNSHHTDKHFSRH